MDVSDDNTCFILTVKLICNDCETLKSLALSIKEPVYSMFILQYYALFCSALKEYLNQNLLSSKNDSENANLRNMIKNFDKRFGKIKNIYLSIDKEQDEDFQSIVRFEFIKKNNRYYNLGIYFDNKKRIIGNTHLATNFLNCYNGDNNGVKAYQIGKDFGRIIGSFSDGLSKQLTMPYIKLNNVHPEIMFLDINTNKNMFFNKSYSKEINLILLHGVSTLNFVQYCLEPIFLYDNPWIMRVKYISTYYVHRGLLRIKKHLEQNSPTQLVQDIEQITQSGECLFSSIMRNCMMHFDLKNNGEFAISKDCYDFSKPLFGLIETCFGMSYNEYFNKLSDYGKKLDKFISDLFDIKNAKIKPLD